MAPQLPLPAPPDNTNTIYTNGSASPPPPAPPPARRTVTILITGFGPFQDRFPINPSFEIPKLLPPALTLTTPSGVPVDVNLIHYPDPIRVCYTSVRTAVPLILDAYTSPPGTPSAGLIDMVLHMGMASGRKFYTLEVQAHRDGYDRNRDVEGEVLPGDHGERVFGDCPSVMRTSLDFEGVMEAWRGNVRRRRRRRSVTVGKGRAVADGEVEGLLEVGEEDCRPSEDAGHYLCDYIYLNTLAWFGRRNGSVVDGGPEDRPVLFLHVPAESDEGALERGRIVTVALIESMVENWVDRVSI